MNREGQAVQTRGDCAQSGPKRCPDVDSVAKDRSGAGDNECAEMSKNGKLRPLLVGPRLSFWEKVRHGEAKTEAELAAVIISEFQKLENASIACRPTAPARKKMRHVGQSKKETDRFGHANPYHADFDISNSLCR